MNSIFARRALAQAKEPYPPIYLEALAYHEAGHAVMAVLLEVPIERVAIASACSELGFNGKVFIDIPSIQGQIAASDVALLAVASEPGEQLAPSRSQFATIHKKHRHLKSFSNGLRNDLIQGFEMVMFVYQRMNMSERTAKRYFKESYRDLAAAFVNLNARPVHQIADQLQRRLEVTGDEVASIVRREGPAIGTEPRRRQDAALQELRSDHANLAIALEMLEGRRRI